MMTRRAAAQSSESLGTGRDFAEGPGTDLRIDVFVLHRGQRFPPHHQPAPLVGPGSIERYRGSTPAFTQARSLIAPIDVRTA